MKIYKDTLATAESLTAGMVGSTLADIPGASEVFKGGIIAYCDQAKMDVLHVYPSIIATKGAVSEECAKHMAIIARDKFNTTLGVSLTGNAGPVGSEGKDVGLVYICLHKERRLIARELRLSGDRNEIRMRATLAIFELITATYVEEGLSKLTWIGPGHQESK